MRQLTETQILFYLEYWVCVHIFIPNLHTKLEFFQTNFFSLKWVWSWNDIVWRWEKLEVGDGVWMWEKMEVGDELRKKMFCKITFLLDFVLPCHATGVTSIDVRHLGFFITEGWRQRLKPNQTQHIRTPSKKRFRD